MNPKAKKILLYTTAVVAPLGVGLAIYAIFIRQTKDGITLWDSWTKKGSTPTSPSTPATLPAQSTPSQPAQSGFPLSEGSTGANVKTLQTILNKINANSGQTPLVTDGVWGALTTQAAKTAGIGTPVTQASFNQYKLNWGA